MHKKKKREPQLAATGSLQAGMTLTMTVARKTEIGYFLREGNDEVFCMKRKRMSVCMYTMK